MKIKALVRLKETARRPVGEVLTQERVLPALGDGLRAALGTLKEIPSRIPGKFQTKLFVGQPSKTRDVLSVLKELDFSVLKLDVHRTCLGTRLEDTGKVTTVIYYSGSGVVVVSSNVNDIEI